MALVVVLAGGGTGGHVFPALALAEVIRKREPDAHVRFIGTTRGLETRYVPAAGYALDLVPSGGVLGKNALGKLQGLLAVARGTWQARRLLVDLDADLVVGTGGYASVPGVAAAVSLGIPTAVMETDAHPGRANQLLGRFAKRVFVAYEDAISFFPAGRAVLTGRPVRALPRALGRGNGGKLRLVVTGGSQGARSLNLAMQRALPALAGIAGLEVTHQTGAADLESTRAAYAAAGVRGEVAAFFDDLPARIMRADLVVARAGGTVAELCVAGVASVLVPYPFAANDHQSANARELERAGAARVVPDAELEARFEPELLALLGDPARRAQMGAAALARAKPNAAEEIWAECRALVLGGRGPR